MLALAILPLSLAVHPTTSPALLKGAPAIIGRPLAPLRRSRSPPPAAVLPTISAAAVWPAAATSGAVALGAQLGLNAAFKRSPQTEARSGILAYRVVALLFTLTLTTVGSLLFFNPARWPADAATMMLVPDGTIRLIGAMLFGGLVVWDIPCALPIRKLRRPDMLMHHIGLALGPALVAMNYMPLFYYAFYIGVSELSSVPLAANDLFAELHDAAADVDGSSPRLPLLARLRDTCQVTAAACFVAVRVVGWAWLVWLLFRDTLAVLPIAASAGVRGFLRLQLFMAAAFYSLQLFWFKTIIEYTRTNGLGGAQPDDL